MQPPGPACVPVLSGPPQHPQPARHLRGTATTHTSSTQLRKQHQGRSEGTETSQQRSRMELLRRERCCLPLHSSPHKGWA